MKTKIGKAGICVCIILWLSTHSSQAHCHELITTKSIEQDGVPSSLVEENRHQDYLASFHGISQLLLNQEVVKNVGKNEVLATPQNLSLLGGNQLNTHRALAHHVYVKTKSDIEKLLLQFPLKQNINSNQRLSVENLLEQIIELSTKSIHVDLLNLDLIKDSAVYRVKYDDSKISELVFEFDLTQQGLVHKGKIVSLFFHYLQEYLHTNSTSEGLTTLTNSIFSIESMRLWHFSNDQLTKKRLAKTKTNYLIKPFSTYDFRLFKQKYPKSVGHYFLDQQQSNLIYNQSGLNIWLSSEKNKKPHANSYKIYLRGNNYQHNIENYVALNLLLIALNKDVLESTLSTYLPFAVELSNKTNNDLLSTLEVFKQFTLQRRTFEEAKLAYIKRIKQERSLKKIALIELDKATLSTVNLWPQKAILEAINSIELEQMTDFHEQFLKSLSIDIVLNNDQALAQLPMHITTLKQLFTLDNPNGHLNHYNQYYTPAVGTLLNKRLHIDGDKNFLLDVYVSPTNTIKQELSIQIIVATLRNLLNEEASWLKASYKRVNAFPSIYFHVDGDLNNMGEVKETINTLVLSLKPKVKSYILNNFKKLRDKHFNGNSSAKYAIRPSDVMRIYDDIFLEHNIENILIQLNGKQNQTQFFVALAGKRVH